MTARPSPLGHPDQPLFIAIEEVDVEAFDQLFDGTRSASLRDPENFGRTPLMALASGQLEGVFNATEHENIVIACWVDFCPFRTLTCATPAAPQP